jgi:hypothetical protein
VQNLPTYWKALLVEKQQNPITIDPWSNQTISTIFFPFFKASFHYNTSIEFFLNKKSR